MEGGEVMEEISDWWWHDPQRYKKLNLLGGIIMKRDVKKLTFSAILLSIGFILHQIAPAGVGGVTFDFMVAVLLVILAINRDFKISIVAGIAAGIITALTTKFPGGQIPNMIDKIVTVSVIYPLIRLGKNLPQSIYMGLVGFIGTVVSGSIFLSSAAFLIGLPAPFQILFLTVVLPTGIGNTFITSLLFRIALSAIEKVNPSYAKELKEQK